MAEECGESCTAVTSLSSSVVPPTNWWDLHGPTASALTSWCNNHTTTNNTNIHNPWYRHAIPNPNSNSDEDASISTSSFTNHSGLTVESSRRVVEPAASSSDDTHIWSHVLLNVGGNGDLPSHQDIGENFLDMLSSTKNMFESDYLKKLDTSNNNNNWDHRHLHHHHHHQFSNSSSPNSLSTNNFINNNNKPINFNTHDHHHHHHHNHHSAMAAAETERLSKLSNLISTWSIAPPESATENPQISLRSPPPSTDHHHDRYTKANNLVGVENNIPGLFAPCFGQNNIPKIENGPEEIVEASEAARALLRSFNNSSRSEIGSYHTHHQVGLTGSSSNIMVGDNIGKYHNNYGTMMINSVESYNNSTTGGDSVRNFADVISFSGRLGKPLIDNNTKLGASKSLSILSDHSKKQSPSQTRSNGRGQGNGSSSTEGKKKRSDDENSEISLKKPKQEHSTASSPKIQAPKVKLGERITALQQIVSPFGKTDTASVLYEAIQYIKFLQEQVQLLSNPYMKTNSHKDIWASFDRKADHVTKADHHHHTHQYNHHHHHQMMKVDLRSRGLCLVPVSCTPQVYRENGGSDYWTPTYRGCLYR